MQSSFISKIDEAADEDNWDTLGVPSQNNRNELSF